MYIFLELGIFYAPYAVFGCDDHEPSLADFVKDKRVAKKALSLLETGYEPTGDYGHELYICTSCHTLRDHFFFKLQKGYEKYMPEYKCRTGMKRADFKTTPDRTGTTIIYKNGRDAGWQCPKCGNRTLNCFGLINWD